MTKRMERPGGHVVESALSTHDADLLRKIAVQRRDLSSQQRDALLLVADLLDGAMRTPTPEPGSGASTLAASPFVRSSSSPLS